MTIQVRFRGVAFAYDGCNVLEGVDLDIRAGEFLGVVGPNAGGKSTLIKLMLGLLMPSAGTISVMGETPAKGCRRIGYCPQHPPVVHNFPISVEDTVTLGRLGEWRWMRGLQESDRRVVEEAMAATTLLEIRRRRLDTLSGGQLQRVLVARALACEPAILVLDEPTTNIDLRLEGDIFDLLKGLNRRMTIVVVSHDIGFISEYVDRVACINRTLVCHDTAQLTGEAIATLYGGTRQHDRAYPPVSEFFIALAEHAFLQHALLAGLLASIGCGVMGTYVVIRRLGYMAGGIAHAVLGGMGIAYYLEMPPIGGAMVAALFAALIVGWVSLRWRQQEDTLIGALWAIGMAIGILFISQTPGYSVDLMSYLFGNILLVSSRQLVFMLLVDVIIVATVAVFYRQFQAVVFDEEFARVRGVRTELFYLLLLCLIALTVVLLIQVVGLILVIALLTLPAAIATQHANSIPWIMLSAILLGAVFTSCGIAFSYGPDLPAGATIILCAGVCYLISTVVAQSRRSGAGPER